MSRKGCATIPAFSIPLETRQEFACPWHGDGSKGTKLGKCPLSHEECARAGDGAHECTFRPGSTIPLAHRMSMPMPGSPPYQHTAPSSAATRWYLEQDEGCATHPSPAVGAGVGGSSRTLPSSLCLDLTRRLGHPLPLQINGCAVKEIEAIILSLHPLYPPTSTT